MSDTEIRPALTPEEWRAGAFRFPSPLYGKTGGARTHENGALTVADPGGCAILSDGRRHALAALALYGQPFGFTREDVEALDREIGDARGGHTPATLGGHWSPLGVAWLRSLRDRIAALLPPE